MHPGGTTWRLPAGGKELDFTRPLNEHAAFPTQDSLAEAVEAAGRWNIRPIAHVAPHTFDIREPLRSLQSVIVTERSKNNTVAVMIYADNMGEGQFHDARMGDFAATHRMPSELGTLPPPSSPPTTKSQSSSSRTRGGRLLCTGTEYG